MIFVIFLLLSPFQVIVRGHSLDLEEYVAGVVSAELPSSWPIEALKAQAVASRSYALYFILKGRKEFTGSVFDQAWKRKVPGRVKRAVKNTYGEVLVFPEGSVAPGYFHSTCGGMTESPEDVWEGVPHTLSKYILPVECGLGDESPHFFWRREIGTEKFKKVIIDGTLEGKLIGDSELQEVEIERTKSGRARYVIVKLTNGQVRMPGEDFRQLFSLKSTNFNLVLEGGRIVIMGKGYGHGVGMCQWGARALALEGKKYREILRFYFPLLKLKRWY